MELVVVLELLVGVTVIVEGGRLLVVVLLASVDGILAPMERVVLIPVGQPVCHKKAAHDLDKVLEQNRVINPSVASGRVILALSGLFLMDCKCAVIIAGITSHIAGIMEESGDVGWSQLRARTNAA